MADNSRKDIKVVGLVQPSVRTPIDLQITKIREYINKKGYELKNIIKLKTYSRSITHTAVFYELKNEKPDIVIVYKFSVLGYHCRPLIRNITAVFAAGASELHQAHDGNVITRDEWRSHLKLLKKIHDQPSFRKSTWPDHIIETLKAVPLTMEEHKTLLQLLTTEENLPFNHIATLAIELTSQQIIEAELTQEEIDELISHIGYNKIKENVEKRIYKKKSNRQPA